MTISIVIPVYDEKGRLEKVLDSLQGYKEVLIVDDGSEIEVSDYIDLEKYHNVHLIRHEKNLGYLASIKEGIAVSKGEIVVTMDGDGEHKPEDIGKLVLPIIEDRCDIVFGKRPNIARPSEIFLLKTAKWLTGETIEDAGTGFRAIRSEFAKHLEFQGKCTCGMLLLEAHKNKMRVCEVAVDLPVVNKPRRIALEHFAQFFIVLRYWLKHRN